MRLKKFQKTVSWIDYGEGYVEASWGVYKPTQRQYSNRGESKNREENKERCMRRARSQARRKCMAAGLDHLLTLTYRENIVDKIKAQYHFERFIRLVHHYKPDWKYLCTMERQKRGSIHFHIGVKGFQDVQLLRSLWRRIVGDGNIDVNYVKSKKGLQWKKAQLARYLVKYIGKEMETELNERRFRASPGIDIPKTVIYVPFKFNAKDYALYKVESLGGAVKYVWSPEESNGLYGWACSWG